MLVNLTFYGMQQYVRTDGRYVSKDILLQRKRTFSKMFNRIIARGAYLSHSRKQQLYQ